LTDSSPDDRSSSVIIGTISIITMIGTFFWIGIDPPRRHLPFIGTLLRHLFRWQ
jgi:hypothetical protein